MATVMCSMSFVILSLLPVSWVPLKRGEPDTVVAVRLDGGLVTGLYAVRNPAKLSHLDRQRR